MKNIQINKSISFHSCEAWSKNPQALKLTYVPSLLDWHVRKFIFAIQASFKNSNPTLRLLSMDYRPPLLSIVWKHIQSKNVGRDARFGGISNNCTCTLSSGASNFKLLLLRLEHNLIVRKYKQKMFISRHGLWFRKFEQLKNDR